MSGLRPGWRAVATALALAAPVALLAGCGLDTESEAADARGGPAAGRSGGGRGGGGSPGGPPGGFGAASTTAIPIAVTPVERRGISEYLETNGTLQAENDVDLVARVSGPIVELNVEEGMQVSEGQLLARIDPAEISARRRSAQVTVEETELELARARAAYEQEILSREIYDQALATLESAKASLRETEVQLSYTDIRAPFSGLITERHIKFAEHVSSGDPLFRISDFDPLECPIQVPEKDLGRLRRGQPAYLTVEAFPGERFVARVLRVSPVVDSATGTVKVTLEVDARNRLRPGMFASVFLETDRHDDALMIPKAALVLESIGDTVYVRNGEVAERREVRLGYDEGDHVEVVAGLEEGDEVIVLGQDSLADGTPVYVLGEEAPPTAPTAGGVGAAAPAGGGPPPGFDPTRMTPEMEERARARMRERGLDDAQIEERLRQMRNGELRPGGQGAGGPPGAGRSGP